MHTHIYLDLVLLEVHIAVGKWTVIQKYAREWVSRSVFGYVYGCGRVCEWGCVCAVDMANYQNFALPMRKQFSFQQLN